MGYGDYVMGDSVISRVYYVEGLGHNLFSVGQFCDSDLEVAFRKHTCFVRDLNGTYILKGSRGTNLYTISIDEMMKSSPICLLSKASKSKSWLSMISHSSEYCASVLILRMISENLGKFQAKVTFEFRWVRHNHHPRNVKCAEPIQVNYLQFISEDGQRSSSGINIVGNPSRPSDPKNFKNGCDRRLWFHASKMKFHEFDRLELWELVASPNSMSGYCSQVDLQRKTVMNMEYHCQLPGNQNMILPPPPPPEDGCKTAFLNCGSSRRGLCSVKHEDLEDQDNPTHRYQAKPTKKHFEAIKRVFRYLKGTINMGLLVSKDTRHVTKAFMQMRDHAGCSRFKKKYVGKCTVSGEIDWYSNSMAEQIVPAQPPTRTDEQINILDILKNTNFFLELTASANVPASTANRFWKTMSYNEKTGLGYPEPIEVFVSVYGRLCVSHLGGQFYPANQVPGRKERRLARSLLKGSRLFLSQSSPERTQFEESKLLSHSLWTILQQKSLSLSLKVRLLKSFWNGILDPNDTEAHSTILLLSQLSKTGCCEYQENSSRKWQALCNQQQRAILQKTTTPTSQTIQDQAPPSTKKPSKRKLPQISEEGNADFHTLSLETPQEKEKEGSIVPIREPGSEQTPKLQEVVGKGKGHLLLEEHKRDQTPPDLTTGPSSQPEDDTSEKVQTVTFNSSRIAPFTNVTSLEPSLLVTPPPINTEATTITTSLPEIAKLEQEMSEVKKTDVLASIRSQVPTAVDNYLGTKLDDALLKVLERHTADLIEKYSVLPGPESVKNQESEKTPIGEYKSQNRTLDKEKQIQLTHQIYSIRSNWISDDDEDDEDDEGPSAGSNQGRSTKKRRSDSAASGSAKPPPNDDDQSSQKPRESDASASDPESEHSEQSSDDLSKQDERNDSDMEDTDNAHIPKVSTTTWFKPIPESERPATP
ncbi:hypothetical protein Tco_0459159 [Tanacetum coccineum]